MILGRNFCSADCAPKLLLAPVKKVSPHQLPGLILAQKRLWTFATQERTVCLSTPRAASKGSCLLVLAFSIAGKAVSSRQHEIQELQQSLPGRKDKAGAISWNGLFSWLTINPSPSAKSHDNNCVKAQAALELQGGIKKPTPGIAALVAWILLGPFNRTRAAASFSKRMLKLCVTFSAAQSRHLLHLWPSRHKTATRLSRSDRAYAYPKGRENTQQQPARPSRLVQQRGINSHSHRARSQNARKQTRPWPTGAKRSLEMRQASKRPVLGTRSPASTEKVCTVHLRRYSSTSRSSVRTNFARSRGCKTTQKASSELPSGNHHNQTADR